MTHIIPITTIESLVLNKALWLLDLENDLDKSVADRLIDKINGIVDKDLREGKERQQND